MPVVQSTAGLGPKDADDIRLNAPVPGIGAYAFVITALGTPIGSPDAQTSKAAKGALSP